jgi:hypothetical protein
MIVGGDKITEAADRLLAKLDEDDELVEVAEVIVIAAIQYGATDDGEAERGSLFYRCSSPRPYVQFGLLADAHRAMLAAIRSAEDEAE